MEFAYALLNTQISVLAIACSAVSIVPRFRTPEWRPYRAAMFVSMGLSAIFPVLQGMQLYGVNKLKGQIGLYWLVGQGALYILGAGIYAVCDGQLITALNRLKLETDVYGNVYRLVYPSACIRVNSTSGEAPIRSFMCWCSWPRPLICSG